MEQQETIVGGWCSNCTCEYHYHLGDSAGICLDCLCAELIQDADSDLFNRLATIYKEDEEVCIAEIVEEEEDHGYAGDQKFVEIIRLEIFLGKASRSCKSCGEIKLYKDFNNSRDPNILCNYCAWEDSELAMLQAMTERERLEIAEMEDAILENEMAYDEALERQEMIDEVLRGLDE